MKNIYFVQTAKNSNDITVYLPYASGCLIAYAMQDADIASNYMFKDIIFLRDKIEKVMNSIEDPYLIAFSCCLWNIEYSKTLTLRIKEKYPDCIVVFGGHYVSNNVELLRQYPFIDFSIRGEGERTFAALLKCLLKGSGFDDVLNLAYRCKSEILNNKTFNDYELEYYPSPYLTGVFDSIFKKYSEYKFHTILETNRGCPYDCAFCEWCFTKAVRYFPLDKVKKEIDWMSENKIEYCYCADANFGIAQRDVEIANYVVLTRKKNGFPGIFRPTYAKNSNDTVFEAGKILNLNGADKGVTISYQSLNETTLEIIGRKELNVTSFSELESKYSAEGIPTYTELILGLPGETYESFCNGLCQLLEAGQHNSLAVYPCQIYSNALMCDPVFQKKFGIKTVSVPINGAHYKADFNGIVEFYDVVVGTADMTTDEWVKANMFSVVLQAFHSLGLLRCFTVYMHYEKGMGYCEFTNHLMSFIQFENGTYLQNMFQNFEKRFSNTSTGDWIYTNDKFGEIGWYFEEAAFLELIYDWDIFWKEILPFLKRLDIPDDIFCELLKYQQFIIRRPDVVSATADFSYDFFGYFDRIYCGNYLPLEKSNCRMKINTNIIVSSWEEYALKIILGGKRRGETLFTNEKGSVTIKNTK